MVCYTGVSPAIQRLGITVFEYSRVAKAEYFAAAEAAKEYSNAITRGIGDPVDKVLKLLMGLYPTVSIRIANEASGGQYFAGIYRRIQEGTRIHIDFAPAEHPGWAVSNVIDQLALNIYLEIPRGSPGVVEIWNRQWEEGANGLFKVDESYGFESAVVDDVASASIVPAAGMMMLINTRRYHRVAPADGARLTFSLAVGRTEQGELILWS